MPLSLMASLEIYMFPLAGKDFPKSSDELAAAIEKALSEVLTFPTKGSVVTVKGGAYPNLRQVEVDLSGAKLATNEPPPPPKPRGKRQPGITVDKLDVVGKPIRYQESEADLELNARGVSFDFAHDTAGNAMLVLKEAEDGRVQVKVDKDDLQSMLRAAASTAAKQQGVTIQDLQVNLASEGPRSIGGEVRVKAKKLMMSGTVTIKGKVDIDDDLVATLSGLSSTGEGVVGSMASGFLQGKLRQVEGKRIPLMAFSLGDVSLSDLKISLKNALQISAEFGRKK